MHASWTKVRARRSKVLGAGVTFAHCRFGWWKKWRPLRATTSSKSLDRWQGQAARQWRLRPACFTLRARLAARHWPLSKTHGSSHNPGGNPGRYGWCQQYRDYLDRISPSIMPFVSHWPTLQSPLANWTTGVKDESSHDSSTPLISRRRAAPRSRPISRPKLSSRSPVSPGLSLPLNACQPAGQHAWQQDAASWTSRRSHARLLFLVTALTVRWALVGGWVAPHARVCNRCGSCGRVELKMSSYITGEILPIVGGYWHGAAKGWAPPDRPATMAPLCRGMADQMLAHDHWPGHGWLSPRRGGSE